jgi:hypothetical protein
VPFYWLVCAAAGRLLSIAGLLTRWWLGDGSHSTLMN